METWAKPNVSLPNITGYDLCFQNNRDYVAEEAPRGSGGIAIYLSHRISKFATLWRTDKQGSIIWVKLDKQLGFNNDLYIAGCYFPPHDSTFYNWAKISNLFEDLCYDIAGVVNANGVPLIAGDLNARIDSHNLLQYNTESSHMKGTNDKTLEGLGFLPQDCDSRFQGSHLLHRRQSCDHGQGNAFGKELLDICRSTGLEIINGRIEGDMTGACTYHSNRDCKKVLIDKGTCKHGCNTNLEVEDAKNKVYEVDDQSKGESVVDYFIAPPTFIMENCRRLDFDHETYPDSDHSILFLTLKVPHYPATSASVEDSRTSHQKIRYVRDQELREKYRSCFEEEHIAGILEAAVHASDPQEAALLLHEGIRAAVSATYSVTENRPNSKFPRNKWYDAECRAAKNKFRQTLHTPDTHLRSQYLRDYKRIVQRKKRTYSEARCARLVDLAKNNPGRFWRLFKRKKSKCPIQDKSVWHSYFQQLLNILVHRPTQREYPSDTREIVEGNLGRLGSRFLHLELNGDILESEVAHAIEYLKRNRSIDLEGIRAEYLIDAIEQLKSPIAKIFQKVFSSGKFPLLWSQSFIAPIFKKGDPNDCNNYRGISVGSTLGKLYAIILEKRITAWAEGRGLRARGQAGFRNDYRTIDNAFVLQTLIEKSKFSPLGPNKLYTCFVDFSKAFDTIPRDLLWKRLEEIGLSNEMIMAVKSMYANVLSCVKTPTGFTEFFTCTRGVRQGCPLSPLLFGLYIDELENILLRQPRACDAPAVQDTLVPSLMYADDIVLLSKTKQGLQKMLDSLAQFADERELVVNLSKTNVVIFNDDRTAFSNRNTMKFIYKGNKIDITDQYTYLGIVFNRNGTWKPAKRALLTSARKALFAMYQRIHDMDIKNPPLQMNLFDALITPITEYGSEIWGIDCLNMSIEKLADFELEKLHRSFLKNLLKLRKSVSSKVLLAECGREPLYFRWKRGILRYFNYLVQLPRSRVLLKNAFLENLALARHGYPSWTHSVHIWFQRMTQCEESTEHIFRILMASQTLELGGNSGEEAVSIAPGSAPLPSSSVGNHTQCSTDPEAAALSRFLTRGDTVSLQDVPTIPNPEWPTGSLIESSFKKFEQACYYKRFLNEAYDNNDDQESKVRLYFDNFRRLDLLKKTCDNPEQYEVRPAPYLSRVHNRQLLIVLARFRTSCHNLRIETGRWLKPKLDRSERLCSLCSTHVVEDERHFICDCPLYQEIRDKFGQKLRMTSDGCIDFQRSFLDTKIQYELGQFILQCENIRTGILS